MKSILAASLIALAACQAAERDEGANEAAKNSVVQLGYPTRQPDGSSLTASFCATEAAGRIYDNIKTCSMVACDQGDKESCKIAETFATQHAPDQSADAASTEPELGRCHMDECSWSLTKSRTVVRREVTGTLLRLSLLGGTSSNANDDGNAPIRWNAKPHTANVFCSNRLPAVIMKTDAGFQVDVLDFVNGIPGALESSANLYVRICHPNDNWNSKGFAERNRLPDVSDFLDVTINGPEEIFQVADRIPNGRSD